MRATARFCRMKANMRNAIFILALTACASATAASKEAPLIAKSKRLIVDSMKDPESTRFRNVRMRGDVFVCGEVNSKNSMGGYVGFRRFIVTAGVVDLLDDDGEGFNILFRKNCLGMKPPEPAPYYEKSWDDMK